jgi:hypothetical protein
MTLEIILMFAIIHCYLTCEETSYQGIQGAKLFLLQEGYKRVSNSELPLLPTSL